LFNLIVKFAPWADGRDTIPDGRTFEHTEQRLVDRFRPAGQLDINALIAIPTLFVQETSGVRDQVAHTGTITGARRNGPNITLEYSYDIGVPPLPNRILQGFAAELDIEDWEFNRTHWAVKDADLYRTLLRRNSQPRRQRPSVFQVAEHENIEPSLVSAMMP
jgi:hypothetical protein